MLIIYYYANGGLPAGSSDDVRRVHGRRRGQAVVELSGVVGVVLLHGPDGGVLNGLLFLQLQGTEEEERVSKHAEKLQLHYVLIPK